MTGPTWARVALILSVSRSIPQVLGCAFPLDGTRDHPGHWTFDLRVMAAD
jgi:hypothetical protein